MIKAFFKLLLVLGIIVYLGFAFFHFSMGEKSIKCRTVKMIVADSMHAGFITGEAMESILRRSGEYPKGRLFSEVDCKKMQDVLEKDPFIKKAECYKTPGGQINVIITQRLPILRVMADNGDDYYIDDKGYRMNPSGYDADLAVVTGAADEAFVRKNLVGLGNLLRTDEFWDSQIEQINVTEDHEIEFVMRVGTQIVKAGEPKNFRVKLNNLYAFYQKVLPEVGWNRYKEISIAYDNQVICKK